MKIFKSLEMSFLAILLMSLFFNACNTNAESTTKAPVTTDNVILESSITIPESKLIDTTLEGMTENPAPKVVAPKKISVQSEKAITVVADKIPVKAKKSAKENVETVTEKIINTPAPSGTDAPSPLAVTTETPKEKSAPKVKIVETAATSEPEVVTAMAGHGDFDALLQKYVSASGKVNYKGLKTQESELNSYLSWLENNHPAASTKRNAEMAYWINAYNAFTLKLILKNYPTSSITKLEGGKPWDVKWIKLGDNTYSLNQIENDILRPKFGDARIHFAVNCAAKSCPPLANKAFTASNLESLLEQQTKAFVNNPSMTKLSASSVEISKIFEWYAADFPNLIEFLNKYSATKIKAGAKVSYAEYNWSLN